MSGFIVSDTYIYVDRVYVCHVSDPVLCSSLVNFWCALVSLTAHMPRIVEHSTSQTKPIQMSVLMMHKCATLRAFQHV